jgi:hypothetical protein
MGRLAGFFTVVVVLGASAGIGWGKDSPHPRASRPAGSVGIFAAPGNDSFATPTTIVGASGCQTGTNVDATAETNEPGVAGDDADSVWYSWSAPSDADVTFRVFLRSMADSTLGVYQGAAVDQLTEVASNDDTYDLASEVTFKPATGETYMIRIGAYDPTTEEGTFALQWGGGCPSPANDDFASARTISGAVGSLSAQTNEAATQETGELDTQDTCTDNDCTMHADLGGNSVWYSWTAPGDINDMSICVRNRPDGADLYPAVAVYTGSLGSLTEVAYSTGVSGAICVWSLTFDAVNGTTYMIGVGGTYGSTGAFDLIWGDPAGPVCSGTTIVSCVFSTVAASSFTVPAGVNLVTIEAKGAEGGGGNFAIAGGKGAQVKATFPVTAGEVLNVVVGGMGLSVQSGGGGGGGSFVFRTPTPLGLLIAAAGGGGARATHAGLDGSATTTASDGEDGGGIGGDAGIRGHGGGGGTGTPASAAGGGGLLTDGGNGTGASPAIGGQALINGAAGGAGESSDTGGGHGGFGGGGGAATFGGGGGGGYNGGGGGSDGSGAGGGGGSFCARSAINTSGTSGANTGNGQVVISYTTWSHNTRTAPGWHRSGRDC